MGISCTVDSCTLAWCISVCRRVVGLAWSRVRWRWGSDFWVTHPIILYYRIQSMLPVLHKQPRLKPLALGDVIAAFIHQQNTQDLTEEYKQLLGERWSQPHHDNIEQQQQLQLPEFACRELTHEEILAIHIRNKEQNPERFRVLLGKVDARIKQTLAQYGDKLTEGQQAIDDLSAQLRQSCEQIRLQRAYIGTCVHRVSKGYAGIGPKVRKINNIGKVMEIMAIWGQCKLPYLFSIDVSSCHRYDISEVLPLFRRAGQVIREHYERAPSEAIHKILQALAEKQTRFITCIVNNFTDSIVKFTNLQQYKLKYQQYLYLLSNNLTEGNLLTPEGIKSTIATNVKSIFLSILIKLTPNLNVDLLNSNLYLSFFDQCIEDYVIYFSSWHRVTTYHLDNDTGCGQLYLQNRKNVFLVCSDRLKDTIANSKKFIGLEYGVKMKLVEKLQDYLEAGGKWMGNYEGLELPKIVIEKLSKQLENIFGLYNNLIKNILTQELSVVALEAIDQPHQPIIVKISLECPDISYQKASAFLSYGSPLVRPTAPTTKSDVPLPASPQVRLKIGSTLAQMLSEYLERAKYLETNKTVYIQKIVDHFEFILFMLYQVCVRDPLKQRINCDVATMLAEIEASSKEQMSVKDISQVYKVCALKRSYFQVLHFLKQLGSKFDGIKIAGIIDVNRVFETNNPAIIGGFTKLVTRVVHDLLKVMHWLIEVIPHTPLAAYKDIGKFAKLLEVLKLVYKLVLENNMDMVYRKYVEGVAPMIGKMKWEIKKFNNETALLYKDYKLKIMDIFRGNSLIGVIRTQMPQFAAVLADKQGETLYRALLECYGKIDKINDNGRQLIRMDSIQISKFLFDAGATTDTWSSWFDRYMDLTAERSYKAVLEKVGKISMLYEPVCWRYQLMWVVGDLSSREKKDYSQQLVKAYLNIFSSC